MRRLLALVAVEGIVGKEQPFGKGHHLFGDNPFAREGHSGLLGFAEHGDHLVRTATEALLGLLSHSLAIEIDNEKSVRQAVKHYQCVDILLAAAFQVLDLAFAQRQVAFRNLRSVKEDKVALKILGAYLFYIKLHLYLYLVYL